MRKHSPLVRYAIRSRQATGLSSVRDIVSLVLGLAEQILDDDLDREPGPVLGLLGTLLPRRGQLIAYPETKQAEGREPEPAR